MPMRALLLIWVSLAFNFVILRKKGTNAFITVSFEKFSVNPLKTESESELLYDWRFTANPFILATSPLRLTTNIFFS
jgi:hypothetical protein